MYHQSARGFGISHRTSPGLDFHIYKVGVRSRCSRNVRCFGPHLLPTQSPLHVSLGTCAPGPSSPHPVAYGHHTLGVSVGDGEGAGPCAAVSEFVLWAGPPWRHQLSGQHAHQKLDI